MYTPTNAAWQAEANPPGLAPVSPPANAPDASTTQAPVAIDHTMFDAYIHMLFRHVEDCYAVMFRGIGESCTHKEGKFHRNVSMPLEGNAAKIADTLATVQRWSEKKAIGTFIVPAAMDPSILNDNKGTEDRLRLFTSVVVDLDQGRPAEAVKHLTLHVAAPTMIVASGGITTEGQPKLHVYWALSEPTAEIQKVAALRGLIASKVNGDPSFKRATQVIRVPGTVYGKGGVARLCRILDHDERREIHL